MLNTNIVIKPEDIIEIVLRRRWFIIIPFCLSIIIGIYLAITLPKAYRARTLIMVQPPRVPTSYVRPVISAGISSRLSIISQQVMSRTNLENIIEQFKLYSEPKYEKMYIEDKIANMRKRIYVNIMGRSDAFALSFEGTDPERIMRVTNTLATYFIDENLKVREAQVIGTTDFLDDELNNIRSQLEEREEAIREYHKRYSGELPEQLETNLRIFNQLQEQLNEKKKSLRYAKNILIAFEKQISGLQNDVSMFSTDGLVKPETENSAKLDKLKEQLSILKTRYTDKHPDVVHIKRMIAELGGQDKETDDLSQGSGQGQSERNEITEAIKILEADISKIKEQISIYQKRVENTPKREQEILSLQRDYGNIKSTYSSILNKKLEAEISVNLEKKQKGEQFRILDPARLPQKPIKPNMKRLFIITLSAGLVVGCGLVLLLELLDTSFRRPEDIDSLLGLPVIAIVPSIIQAKDIKRKRLNNFLCIFSIIITSVLFAGFAVLTFKGVDQTIDFVRSFVRML